jgi:hypothetical protein
MSEARRCGSFCRRHYENSFSLFCLSAMWCEREVMHSLTLLMQEEENAAAKVCDPTG